MPPESCSPCVAGEEVVLVNARCGDRAGCRHAGARPFGAAAPAAAFATPPCPLAEARWNAVFAFGPWRRSSSRGPAIIESDTTTVLLLPGDTAPGPEGWLA